MPVINARNASSKTFAAEANCHQFKCAKTNLATQFETGCFIGDAVGLIFVFLVQETAPNFGCAEVVHGQTVETGRCCGTTSRYATCATQCSHRVTHGTAWLVHTY